MVDLADSFSHVLKRYFIDTACGYRIVVPTAKEMAKINQPFLDIN